MQFSLPTKVKGGKWQLLCKFTPTTNTHLHPVYPAKGRVESVYVLKGQ